MFNTLIVLLGGCLLLSPILFFLGSSRAELEQLPSNASFASYGKTLLKGLFPFLLVVFSPLGDSPLLSGILVTLWYGFNTVRCRPAGQHKIVLALRLAAFPLCLALSHWFIWRGNSPGALAASNSGTVAFLAALEGVGSPPPKQDLRQINHKTAKQHACQRAVFLLPLLI